MGIIEQDWKDYEKTAGNQSQQSIFYAGWLCGINRTIQEIKEKEKVEDFNKFREDVVKEAVEHAATQALREVEKHIGEENESK